MSHILDAQEWLPSVDCSSSAARKPGTVRRIVQAMFKPRQAQVDREIAGFLARSGGRLTNDMERRLTEHLLSGNWTVRD